MPTNVLMPKTGADETVAKLARWLKKEGDEVKRGEMIAEIETDKVNMEVEAFGEGTLYRILVQEGESMDVGKPIAILLKAGEQPPADLPAARSSAPVAPATAPAAQSSAPAPLPAPAQAVAPAMSSPKSQPSEPAPSTSQPAAAVATVKTAHANGADGRIKASPLAKKIALEHNLDLRSIPGRGPGGRVVRDDVEAALQAGTATSAAVATSPQGDAESTPVSEPALAASGEKSLTRIQLTAGRRLAESKQNAPHFYVTIEVDMAEALKLRASLNEQADGSVKISVNDLVVKATAWALLRHPNLNSTYKDGKLLLHDRVNISVAVAMDEGLVSPVIPDVDRKSLGQVARETRAVVERARSGKLRPEDYADGTFTISNLGMFDVDTFIAIINPPQAGILAVGTVRQVPVVRDGQLAVGQIMKVTLSADHRATDGAQGARFLADVKRALEKPLLMAL